MTHPGTPRDVNLAEWLNAAGFHPANTELKQLSHEAARKVIGELGTVLWQLLPASREKSIVFTQLEQARHYANQALAVHGGPGGHVTILDIQRILDGSSVEMPEDPRIAEYKDDQLEGEPFDQRTALEDRVYALLRQELGGIEGGWFAVDYRRAAVAVVRALAGAIIPPATQLPPPALRPPLQQPKPFTQLRYSTGEDPGPVREILVKFQEHWADPVVSIELTKRDEGENIHDSAGLDLDDPDVLDEIAAGITAAAGRLRAAQAKR